MIYPAAKVVLIDRSQSDKLLLIYREINGSGGYEAAGGRLEVDFTVKIAEDFETCAVREIKEEVGVDVKLLSYLGSYSFFWDIKQDACSGCVVFLGEIIGGKISNVNLDESEHTHENVWVDANNVLNNTIPIRDNHAGLRPLLIKAAKLILSNAAGNNVLDELTLEPQSLSFDY